MFLFLISAIGFRNSKLFWKFIFVKLGWARQACNGKDVQRVLTKMWPAVVDDLAIWGGHGLLIDRENCRHARLASSTQEHTLPPLL